MNNVMIEYNISNIFSLNNNNNDISTTISIIIFLIMDNNLNIQSHRTNKKTNHKSYYELMVGKMKSKVNQYNSFKSSSSIPSKGK